MAAEGHSIDALGQFKLHTVGSVFGSSVNFTQSNLMMLVAGALILALLYFGARPKAVVPGRLQAAAELAYDFIHSMCTDQIGEEGRRFFPFVFTLFFFILFGNLLGLLPFSFTYTSHIAVTATLALTVIVLVTVVALRIHGLHFFSYFFPSGAPKWLAPIIIPIEIISYLSRPVSLSIRLFANMVAGHVMFEVFASFMLMMAAAGIFGYVGAVGPLVLNVALMGFELLVAVLQAYVFAILTCIYLHDAVHLH
ncbi:ATP synthase subunit a [Rhodovastum atsumiense]|uniref:ATP synthase subunit a n=1 Tax=Rhodovastum atsumiense TaxID=504468 RepID=A0A5M6J245_9PROT|nr:F0F1 ATP synthase subunit A [Rhodovastum atsumiense]KAA5613695.1 F0F1 ATP synthase subunit A [Rhodovastum atsumiense]CAH2599613.1 ATP synthase subunit a [Rhodovastum atsumiense]